MKFAKAPSDISVLLLLKDFNDRMTKYAIKKATGLTFTWVREVVGVLKAKGLIDSKVIGTAPGGQKMEVYAPTLRGVFTVLYERPELWDRIDEIASKQVRLLPLVFGEWNRLAQPELKGFLLRTLRTAFGISAIDFKGYHRSIEGELIPPRETEEDYRLSIYWLVFSQMTLIMKNENRRRKEIYLKAIKDSPELSVFTTRLLRELVLGNEALVLDYRSMLEAMKGNPKSFVSETSAQAKFDKNRKAKIEKMKGLMIKLEEDLMKRFNPKLERR